MNQIVYSANTRCALFALNLPLKWHSHDSHAIVKKWQTMPGLAPPVNSSQLRPWNCRSVFGLVGWPGYPILFEWAARTLIERTPLPLPFNWKPSIPTSNTAYTGTHEPELNRPMTYVIWSTRSNVIRLPSHSLSDIKKRTAACPAIAQRISVTLLS